MRFQRMTFCPFIADRAGFVNAIGAADHAPCFQKPDAYPFKAHQRCAILYRLSSQFIKSGGQRQFVAHIQQRGKLARESLFALMIRLQLAFALLANGHIAEHGKMATGQKVGRRRKFGLHNRAIGSPQQKFSAHETILLKFLPGFFRFMGGHSKIHSTLAQKLFAREAEKLTGRSIHINVIAAVVGNNHGIHRVFKDSPELPFADLKRLLGLMQ